MLEVDNPYMIRLKIFWNRVQVDTEKWQWDALFPLLAGILSLAGAGKAGGRVKDKAFRSILIGEDGYDIIRWSVWTLACLGVIMLGVAVKRLLGYGTQSFMKYISLLVCLVFGHFIVGLILTEYRNFISENLANRLRDQVQQAKIASEKMVVAPELAELWDYMQMTMSCCGAESYQEYGNNPKLLPLTCCVLKPSAFGIPQPENLAQCHHDVIRGVRESMFLNTRGCHEALYTWFLKYTATINGLLFGSISLQAVSILYQSWKGFMTTKDTNS